MSNNNDDNDISELTNEELIALANDVEARAVRACRDGERPFFFASLDVIRQEVATERARRIAQIQAEISSLLAPA